ncbi:MAG TPA: glycosyltransferase [Sphingobium sp.]|uniref:glycosyltransferase n=1 Tax=Sphingobium sp. TaxID=1912891 RepID=UPI002ED26FCD
MTYMESATSPGRRLVVLTNDLPYPPNYGHKVDQYYRWLGFAQRGWRMRLICWRSPQDPPMRDGDLDALGAVFEAIDELPIGYDMASFARRLALLPRYPSHVASRLPDAAAVERLVAEVRAFAPDAIILDGIYGGALGQMLAKACGVPAILRGHNVEHAYFAGQARAVKSIKSKLKWHLARVGLARYETELLRGADWTFDISADDVRYWKDRGIAHISWAPTVYPGPGSGTILPAAERHYDVAYIGNMRLPNNLKGLGWFVGEVLPILRELRPGTSFCFAGANPSDEARAIFAQAPEIDLVPDAPSADDILAHGRVLVNPILSGSGVNVKSIDMLRYDAPIVTTSIGAQGFGREIDGQFLVRNDARSFAEAIVAALADPRPPEGRAEARSLFGQGGLDAQVALIERIIAKAQQGVAALG